MTQKHSLGKSFSRRGHMCAFAGRSLCFILVPSLLASALIACTTSKAPSKAGPEVDPERRPAMTVPPTSDDSFAWLEQRDQRTQEWERAANERTAEFFQTVPGFGEVVERVKRYEDLPAPPKQVDVRGDSVFALENEDSSHRGRLIRKNGGNPSITLFELSVADSSEHLHLDFFVLSPSGRYIALGTSVGGRELTTVRVLDATNGNDLGDRSVDVRLMQLAWYADDTGYLYMRGRGDAVPAIDRSKDFSVAEHVIGQPAERDTEIVGSKASGPRLTRDYDYVYPQASYDGRYDLVEIHHGITPNASIFIADRSSRRGAELNWISIYDESKSVHSVFVAGDHLLALSQIGGKETVEEVSLAHPESRKTHFVSNKPLESVFEIGHSIYALQDGPTGRQIVHIHDGKSDVVTDTAVSVSSSYPIDWSGRRAVFQFQSWSQPGSWHTIDDIGTIKSVFDDQIQVPNAPFETWEMDAPARDGESVHLVLIGPRGDRAPKYIWMSAYGAYGFIPGPAFDAARRVFLDLGGTYLVAQVRGGGERGQAWHDAGRGTKKIKTVEDTIDVVRYLRSRGFGAGGGGIFAYGASAGGIPIGGLFVREPQLIDGAAIVSGVVNMTRFVATSPTAPAQREEYGNSDTKEGARLLRELDAFEGVHSGISYPPLLLVAASNDFRVPYWESTKLAARVQQDTTGSAPILVHITDGGHLGGGDAEMQYLLDAQMLAFALSSVHNPSR